MNGAQPNRASQAVRLILVVSAAALVFFAVSHYATCRAAGTPPVPCFLEALLSAVGEALSLVLITVLKVLMLVLP